MSYYVKEATGWCKMSKSVVADSYDSHSDEEFTSASPSPPTPPKLRRETTADYRTLTPLDLPPRSQFTFTEPDGVNQTPLPSEPRSVMEVEKTCVFCKRDFYTDAEFKTSCPDCYEKFKRKCACGRNIPGDAPKYKTSCTTCWMEARKQTHEKCPSCTGARALHLRKRKDKAECLECSQKKQQDRGQRDRSRDRDRRRTKSGPDRGYRRK